MVRALGYVLYSLTHRIYFYRGDHEDEMRTVIFIGFCILVPFIVGYSIYRIRKEGKRVESTEKMGIPIPEDKEQINELRKR